MSHLIGRTDHGNSCGGQSGLLQLMPSNGAYQFCIFFLEYKIIRKKLRVICECAMVLNVVEEGRCRWRGRQNKAEGHRQLMPQLLFQAIDHTVTA